MSRFFEILFLIVYLPFMFIGIWIHELRGLWDKEPGMHIEPEYTEPERRGKDE
tara:strand:+ start:1238 stop:1396 length:159 start_codon:yes stop_codon:yes gene_type:complete